MSEHRAPKTFNGKRFDWNIARRAVYIIVGMGTAALAKTGVVDADTANELANDFGYLVTSGLFFVAAWFTPSGKGK